MRLNAPRMDFKGVMVEEIMVSYGRGDNGKGINGYMGKFEISVDNGIIV